MTQRKLIFIALGILVIWNGYIRTRFLTEPDSTVFDESFYVKYSLTYCCSDQPYSDLHPPFPKLVYGIFGYFSEYTGHYPFGGGDSSYQKEKVPIAPMRLLHATLGTIVVLVLYALTVLVTGLPMAGLLVAFWVSIENASVLQSSFALLEQFLLLGIFGSLTLYLLAQNAGSDIRRRSLALASGVLLATAIGTKFTGNCAAGAILIDSIWRWRTAKSKLAKNDSLVILNWGLFACLVTYLMIWLVHEQLLYRAIYEHKNLVELFLLLIKRIVTNHWEIMAGHLSLGPNDGAGSRWFHWLAGYKPLLFWVAGKRWMLFFPNYVLWVGSAILAFAIFFARFTLKVFNVERFAVDKDNIGIRLIVLVVAFNYLPNLFIDRVLYLYQYLPALMGLMVINAYGLANLDFLTKTTNQRKRWLQMSLIVIPLIGFFFSLPFSHGITSPDFSKWRQGFYDPSK